MSENNTLIQTQDLTKIYGSGAEEVVAVNKVNIRIDQDSIISLVGQSGSGKTTLARLLLLLTKPTSGSIYYQGEPMEGANRGAKIKYWRKVQGIFQDPYASFNLFYRVRKILQDCYKLFDSPPTKSKQKEEIRTALKQVNLNPDEVLDKFPFEMSGGQRQRIMIARALIAQPQILLADEVTSMIDASSRVNVLNALLNLKEEQDLSIVFITHDMGLAYYVSDNLLIMNEGKIVEEGKAVRIVENPEHPYTQELLNDVPTLEEGWIHKEDL